MKNAANRPRRGAPPSRTVAAADPWSDRLSEYLDGELSHADERAIALHVEECGRCRATLEDLRELGRRAPELAVEREPERDLWPGIARRLAPRATPWWQHLAAMATLRAPERWLASAALAILLVAAAGAAVVWMGTPGRGARSANVATGHAPVPAVDSATGTTSREEAAYDDTVAGLRRIVLENLTADPHVIEVIDRNLESLDVAIADYEDALSRQPGDERLRERLESARQRKLALLRHAADLAAGETN